MTVALGQFTYSEPQNQADSPTEAQLCWRGPAGKGSRSEAEGRALRQSFLPSQQLDKLCLGV